MDTDNPPDPALIEDLVLANRILADQGVVDGFGHASARHDKYPDRFLMSQSRAPAAVTTSDIKQFEFGWPSDRRGSEAPARTIHPQRDFQSAPRGHGGGAQSFARGHSLWSDRCSASGY